MSNSKNLYSNLIQIIPFCSDLIHFGPIRSNSVNQNGRNLTNIQIWFFWQLFHMASVENTCHFLWKVGFGFRTVCSTVQWVKPNTLYKKGVNLGLPTFISHNLVNQLLRYNMKTFVSFLAILVFIALGQESSKYLYKFTRICYSISMWYLNSTYLCQF